MQVLVLQIIPRETRNLVTPNRQFGRPLEPVNSIMAWRNLLQRVGRPLSVRGSGSWAGRAVRSYCSPTVMCVPSRPGRYVAAGVLAVSAFSIPFISVGAYAAKMFASGLEDFDLFVPDDDDD